MTSELLASFFVLVCTAQIGAAAAPGRDADRQAPELPSFTVIVSGEVRYPGRATLTASTMTVPDALAAVGSPTNGAGDSVVVIRVAKSTGVQERRTINIKEMEQAAVGVDVSLEDGDIVNVPIARRFYISGLVKRPGAYKLTAGMTVSQAIVLVGGLSDGGNDRRIRISRKVNGKSIEISVQMDDRILPDDEIKVQRRMF